MRRRLKPYLLLSLFALVVPACQKDVKEVRREEQNARAQEARHKQAPYAPSGEPVGISGAPVIP
jgi:hypothetical protein